MSSPRGGLGRSPDGASSPRCPRRRRRRRRRRLRPRAVPQPPSPPSPLGSRCSHPSRKHASRAARRAERDGASAPIPAAVSTARCSHAPIGSADARSNPTSKAMAAVAEQSHFLCASAPWSICPRSLSLSSATAVSSPSCRATLHVGAFYPFFSIFPAPLQELRRLRGLSRKTAR